MSFPQCSIECLSELYSFVRSETLKHIYADISNRAQQMWPPQICPSQSAGPSSGLLSPVLDRQMCGFIPVSAVPLEMRTSSHRGDLAVLQRLLQTALVLCSVNSREFNKGKRITTRVGTAEPLRLSLWPGPSAGSSAHCLQVTASR